MTDLKNLPTYSTEEVASILSRALDRTHEGGRISHDELLETAREIGVSTLEIEAAVAAEVKARAERILLEEKLDKAKKAFFQHLGGWAVTSAVLFAVDAKTLGGVFWYWVASAWALAVLAHGATVLRQKQALDRMIAAAAPPQRIEVRGGKMEVHPPSGEGPRPAK